MRTRDPLLGIEHVDKKLVRRASGLYTVHDFHVFVPEDVEVVENPVGGTSQLTVLSSHTDTVSTHSYEAVTLESILNIQKMFPIPTPQKYEPCWPPSFFQDVRGGCVMPKYTCPSCQIEHEMEPPNGEWWVDSDCIEVDCPTEGCGAALEIGVIVDILLSAEVVPG